VGAKGKARLKLNRRASGEDQGFRKTPAAAVSRTLGAASAVVGSVIAAVIIFVLMAGIMITEVLLAIVNAYS
jgi:hypothetical protein